MTIHIGALVAVSGTDQAQGPGPTEPALASQEWNRKDVKTTDCNLTAL